VARAEAVAAPRRDLPLAAQLTVLIGEDAQHAGPLGPVGRRIVPAARQYGEATIGADPHLVRKDAGIDRLVLLHLPGDAPVPADPEDPERRRIAEGDQRMARDRVEGHVDRPGRQAQRVSMEGQRAGGRIDREGAQMVTLAGNAEARRAVARCHIEETPGGVRPGILDICRQNGGAAVEGEGGVRRVQPVAQDGRPDTRKQGEAGRGGGLRSHRRLSGCMVAGRFAAIKSAADPCIPFI